MPDIGTVVDDLTTVDVGGRGAVGLLADAAEREQGANPSMRAAEALADAVDPGDAVVVLTGFPIPPAMVQETDGPPGAAAVARAVDAGLDADAIIACDPGAVEVCEAAATAAGLSVVDREPSLGSRDAVAVETLPADRDRAAGDADSAADLDPAAVVAVEKAAPNRAGVYHTMSGDDISGAAGKVGGFLDRLDPAVTVGIGDGGNEVGMGSIEAAVREGIDHGAECRCPCGEGVASAVGAEVLVPAAVSNWGAYAVAACLSSLTGRPTLHDPEVERRMLTEAAMAGAVDGIAGGTTAWCDGMPPGVHGSVVRLLGGALSSHDPV